MELYQLLPIIQQEINGWQNSKSYDDHGWE